MNDESSAAMRLAAPEAGEFRVIVDQLREGVATLEGDALMIGYANPALLRMLGRGEDEVVGRPLTAFLGPDDGARIVEVAQASAAGRIELDLVGRDGSTTPVALSVARIETGGRVLLGLSAFNLTGQHELMRRERERFELVGRRKDEFIAMLGHELRNPLAPLRHAAELLDAAPERSGASPTDIAQVIRRQVDHMARLIGDLLDIGRTTTGRLPVRRQAMRMDEVVDAAVESTERLARRRRHALVCDCSAVREHELDADPIRLTQVVTNLLSNAIKYTPEGGRIDLRCRVDGDALVLTVADNGHGIASDDLEAIFEPFFQTSTTIDRGAGGLGVGLALVRRIVELHGGSVVATSPGPGLGSTFTVRLPGARPRSEVVVAPAPAKPPVEAVARPLHVLVIDDNEDAARMLALLLERRGCAVDVAFLGTEGLALAGRSDYDLAFVDIGLPDLDGYAVAERLVGTRACPRRLVALTGYGQSEDRRRALAAGFHEHVVKPLSPQHLDTILATSAARP